MLQTIAKTYKNLKIDKYYDVYSDLFDSMKEKNVKLLEIGVYECGSLKIWHDYFKQGKIIGLDRRQISNSLLKGFDRISVYQGDQTDINVLQKIINENGKFDIIIDDASHIGQVTKASYNFLFKYVKSGGYYIIEDWGTGYWENWYDGKEYHNNHYDGMVGLVKDLVDEAGRDDIKLDPRTSMFEYMQLSHGQAIIKKK